MLWLGTACADESPISVATVSGLNFGSVSAVSAGSVTVSASGVRTSTPGVVILRSGPGTAAQLSVQSTKPNLSYSLTFDSVAYLVSGANKMRVDGFTSSLDSGKGALGNTGASGAQTVYVGGTLNLDYGQVPGSYTGSFAVTINYP